MKSYELCILFGGKSTESEVDEHAGQIESILKNAGAEIKLTHSLGRKKLAYKIKNHTNGEYRVWLLVAEAEAIPALNEKLRLTNFVVRHLILVLEAKMLELKAMKIREVKTGRIEQVNVDETVSKSTKEQPLQTREPAAATAAQQQPKPEEVKKERENKKASLDELDDKLDEILESDKI